MDTRYLVLVICGFCCFASAKKNASGIDKFRLVLINVSSDNAQEEVSDFLNYGCEALIAISNDAQAEIRIGCKSADDKTKDVRVSPGNSYLFSVRPLADGSSEYWCTLLYHNHWARFDAYSENHHDYLCPGRRIYRYSVRHDGVYADPTHDEGVKIRALFKGHNKFNLWEEYDEVHSGPDGLLMSGFVDGGMCADLPDHFDDKASVVTVCDHQCLLVYDYRRCSGPVQKLQAGNGCEHFRLNKDLVEKVSSIKGC